MNNEEIEENVLYLIEILTESINKFKFDKKNKEIIQQFNFFNEIISKFPDKYDSFIIEILSNLTFKKYNKNEVIYDNNIKNVTDIFFIFLGEIDLINYYISEEQENQEQNKTNEIIKKEIIMNRGESFNKQSFIKLFKIGKKFNENGDLYEDKNCFFRIISKSKCVIGFLIETIYNNILEKYKTKERLEKIYFLQKIEYLPNESNFIERFQNVLIKKCFKKRSLISEQNGELKSIYLISNGTVRLSIIFNKKIHCSLDYDVLIGKLINERFSSARLFEIIGNYRENEKMFIVDLSEGEIIGGVELCKNMTRHIFKIECMTDVTLYEIDIDTFKKVLSSFNLKEFSDKINYQLNFLKNRILNIRNFSKGKSKKDSYSLSRNKFIITYKKGHPLTKEAKEYIRKYTNPFNREETFKNNEFKTFNTRYAHIIDFQKIREVHKAKKTTKIINRNIPFITNIISENISQENISEREISKSIIPNLKYSNKKTVLDSDYFFKKTKENIKRNEEWQKKENKITNHISRKSSNSLKSKNCNSKGTKIINRRRVNSCKLENRIELRRNSNSVDKAINIKYSYNNLNNNKNFYSVKNKLSKKLHFSLDNINFNKNDLNDEVNKDKAKILQNSSQNRGTYLIQSKNFDLLLKKIRKFSNNSINKKKLTFPHGIQEINEKETNNIDNIIQKLISNRLIKKEFVLNKKIRMSGSPILERKYTKIK